jgi:hypothetical protein
MTDERDRGRDRNREPLITRAEAMARARAARPKEPETAVERAAGLHALLSDLAAYLGDRPNRDHDAMALYGRVMRMLGEGGE